MTEQMNVPKLRFNGFEGDWISHRINDVSECITSGSRDWAKYYSDKGDKFIRMTNLGREGINLLLEDMRYVSIPKGGSEGQRTSLQESDILISITAELGKIGIIPKDFGTAYINQHTALVRVNQQVNAKFLAQNLATKKSNKKINRLNDSGAKSGLNLSTIRNFEFTAPASLPEQQKVASFLSKVDEKIALLTKKKDKLTEYKKGVMQQLFNGKWEEQDGQLIFIPPTLRFKADDGSEFPDWDEYKKQIKIVAGNAYKADEYSDSGYLLIQGQNIFPDELRLDETPKHISSKSSNHTTIIKGDIVLGLNRPITNGKLKTCRYPISNPSVLYQRAGKLEFNADEVDSEFLFQYITSPEFMRQLKLELVGSDQPYIKSNLFGVTKNIFPSIDEQRKISSFLASLNIKLDLVNSELEKAKEWKKGLLQQMFV